jgi:hypothetical protein
VGHAQWVFTTPDRKRFLLNRVSEDRVERRIMLVHSWPQRVGRK